MDVCVEQDIEMLTDKGLAFVFLLNVCRYLLLALTYITGQIKELPSGSRVGYI